MPFSTSVRFLLGLFVLLIAAGVPLFGAATTQNPGLKYYYAAPGAPVVDITADIIVYGGTSGGVVAAVQAVRMGKSVALVVFGRHVGGMTSGGLTSTDGVSSTVQGGITREFFDRTGKNTGFNPSKAEQEFEKLLADPVPGATWDGPVPTYYEQRLQTVDMVGARITAMRMENGSVFRGKMFIDCTYEGDLMAKAGVSYTSGRESSAQYGESLAGTRAPVSLSGVNAYVQSGNSSSGLIYNLINEAAGTVGGADSHIQAYNFRMYTVQNPNPASHQPLFQPAAYNAGNLELLYRYHKSGGKTSMTVTNDVNNHEMFDRGCSTDHIGGNRWPDGKGGWIPWCDADYPTRELMYQSHVAWQLGMLWYIKTDSRYRALATDTSLSSTIRTNIQNLLNKVDQLGFPLGEYPETGGWSHELYVREARRMVSDFVVTQAYYDRTIVASDAVGMANYRSDAHHSRRIPSASGGVLVEGDTGGDSTTPWRIPFRSLIPKKSQCENLLVSWAISGSHVAFGSTRMEPCLMVLSQSAATAAALSIDQNVAVQDLPYTTLRTRLLADGQILGTDPPSAPSAASGLSATATSASSISLAWTDNSNNETGFEIDRALNSTFTSGLLTRTVLADITAFSDDTGLSAQTTYHYRVRAVNNVGNSSFTNTASATTQGVSGPPAEPSGLTSSATGYDSAALRWADNSGNEAGFQLQRASDSAFSSDLQAFDLAANTTQFTDTGLTPETSYYYRIDAYNAAGGSQWSATFIATTGLTPSPPTTGTVTATADSFIRDGNSANTNYGAQSTLEIKLTDTDGFVRRTYLKFDVSSFSDISGAVLRLNGGMETATAYTDRSLAVFKTSTTSWIETGSDAITWNNAPAPSGGALATTTITGTQKDYLWDVTSWVAAEKAAGRNVVTLILIDQTIDNGGRAIFNSKEAASNRPALVIQSDAAPPVAPANLAAATVSSTSVAISWQDSSANETSFVLNRSTDPTFTTGLQTMTLPANITSTTVSGLTPGTSYYFRVRATMNGANSAYAGPASAKTYSVLEQWRKDAFGAPGNTGTGANLSDDEADGVPNLIEFAVGLDPKVADIAKSPGLPQASMTPEGKLAVTYLRRKAATFSGVTYRIEFATSALNDWAENPAATESAELIDSTWELVTVTDSFASGEKSARFARLVVTVPD